MSCILVTLKFPSGNTTEIPWLLFRVTRTNMRQRWPSHGYQAKSKSQRLELRGSQAGYRAVLAWEMLANLNPCWQGEIKQKVLLKLTSLDSPGPSCTFKLCNLVELLLQDSLVLGSLSVWCFLARQRVFYGAYSYWTLSHLCVIYYKAGACLLLPLQGGQ